MYRRLHLRFLLIALALIILLPNFAYSSSTPITSTCILTSANVTAGTCILDSVPISLMGVGLSFMIVAIALMINQIFPMSGLKSWYQGELWESVKSLLVIGSIYAIILILSSIAVLSLPPNLTTSSTTPTSSISTNLGDLYTASNNYLEIENTNVSETYYGLFGLNFGLGAIKSLRIATFLPIPFPDGAVQMGSKANLYVSNVIDQTRDALFSFIRDITEIIVIPLLIILGIFLSNTGLLMMGITLFLPAGIILRAIPFLRGIGGELIGIGIAISIILPFLLIFFNYPIASYMIPKDILPTTTPIPVISQTLSLTLLSAKFISIIGVSTFKELASFNIIGAIESSITGMYMFQEELFVSPITTMSIFNANGSAYLIAFQTGLLTGMYNLASPNVFSLFNFIMSLSISALLFYLLSILDIILTVISADSIARLLGGHVRLGIGKFKIA